MGNFELKHTNKKMKVLVLLACLGACSAQYLLTTTRNLGSSHNAPPVQNLGGSSRFGNGGSVHSSGGNSGHSRFGGNSGFSSGGNDVHVSSIRHGNTGGGSGFSSGSSGHGRIISHGGSSGRFRSYN